MNPEILRKGKLEVIFRQNTNKDKIIHAEYMEKNNFIPAFEPLFKNESSKT